MFIFFLFLKDDIFLSPRIFEIIQIKAETKMNK